MRFRKWWQSEVMFFLVHRSAKISIGEKIGGHLKATNGKFFGLTIAAASAAGLSYKSLRWLKRGDNFKACTVFARMPQS